MFGHEQCLDRNIVRTGTDRRATWTKTYKKTKTDDDDDRRRRHIGCMLRIHPMTRFLVLPSDRTRLARVRFAPLGAERKYPMVGVGSMCIFVFAGLPAVICLLWCVEIHNASELHGMHGGWNQVGNGKARRARGRAPCTLSPALGQQARCVESGCKAKKVVACDKLA